MSQKLEFVERASAEGTNFSALCREFGIARETGYKWLRRYRAEGYLGLVDLSRRPKTSPLATGEDIVVGIIELRDHHPTWGPLKISQVLERRLRHDAPSRSTVARILRRVGRVRKRRPRVRTWTVGDRPHVEVKGPNDLWTMDFKGWWRARNGEKCEPLTVRDAFSRRVLAVELVSSTGMVSVRRVLERLFRQYGLPFAMQCDNGQPFVSTRARGGLTQLSAWFVSLGIGLVRSRLASPQDNGAHERMHRDLSELELTPAKSRRAQQRQCDRWLIDFNHVRPHDALGGKTPAEVYRKSERRAVLQRVPNYPPEWITRRVSETGNVRVNGDTVFLSSALAGMLVGLRQVSLLRWRARFFDVDLGIIEVAPMNHLFGDSPVEPVITVHGSQKPQARKTNGSS